ncbi:MAG: PAS domain-containing protein, partial [Hungatella sp.]
MKTFSEVKADLMQLSLPIGLIITTAYPDYHIVFVNAKFCEMLGFQEEDAPLEILHKSAWDYIYSEDIERLQEEAAKRNGDPELYEISYRAVRQDGSILWI